VPEYLGNKKPLGVAGKKGVGQKLAAFKQTMTNLFFPNINIEISHQLHQKMFEVIDRATQRALEGYPEQNDLLTKKDPNTQLRFAFDTLVHKYRDVQTRLTTIAQSMKALEVSAMPFTFQ